MDLGTAIVGIAIIIICVIPFVLLQKSKKKAEQKLVSGLDALAAAHQSTIAHREVFGDFAIGHDKGMRGLFFYKITTEGPLSQYVDLAGIKSCKVVNTNRTFQNKEGAYKVIEKLELSLAPLAANQSEIALEFYDVHKNIQLNGELQSIERWAKLVNEKR